MNAAPEQPTAHADPLRGGIACRSEFGSFIEDRLGPLVDGPTDASRSHVDVMHSDLAVGR